MPYQDLLKGRFSQENCIYHVTWATANRTPLLTEFDQARIVIHSLRYAHEKNWCYSYSFVVMPDHVHWLVQIRAKTLNQLIHSIKSFTANQISSRTRLNVWQRGYFDQALRREDQLKPIARYIVANPVRAGLVTNIGDYAHWDAVWL